MLRQTMAHMPQQYVNISIMDNIKYWRAIKNNVNYEYVWKITRNFVDFT